jgi:hypothetical protein
VTEVIGIFENPPSSWVTPSVAASEGKKTDEGTMMWPREPEPNAVAVVDPSEAQTLMHATTKEASDILTNCKISF